MPAQYPQAVTSTVCAYCGKPLALVGLSTGGWRIRDQLVCNEFCADGLPSPSIDAKRESANRLVALH